MNIKKIALITGGHHSLGLAIAKEFAKNNYNLIITYHSNEEKAKKAIQELESFHIEVDTYKVDLSSIENTSRFIAAIKEKYNSLDTIINNAALTVDSEMAHKNIADFARILNVNTIAPYHLAKELSPLIKKGSIINIASTNGIDTISPLTLEYDASKSALISLTKNLSIALSPNIRVNAVAPGWINTESVLAMSPNYTQEEKAKILLKRFADPQEIAKVVYFLASEDASYINGTTIRVDGGTIC